MTEHRQAQLFRDTSLINSRRLIASSKAQDAASYRPAPTGAYKIAVKHAQCPLGVISDIRNAKADKHLLWPYRLCNLVHCCRAAIGAIASEPYCRSMLDRPSDEDISRQILGVFMRHQIPAAGTLQRNYFFEVRDSDFQRGINKAVANNWITIDLRNRYRYHLTTTGYAVGRMIDQVLGA